MKKGYKLLSARGFPGNISIAVGSGSRVDGIVMIFPEPNIDSREGPFKNKACKKPSFMLY
jgi:hypothetical protein